jgi:hypothetical protein
MDWHVRWLEAVAVGCEHHGKVGLVIVDRRLPVADIRRRISATTPNYYLILYICISNLLK